MYHAAPCFAQDLFPYNVLYLSTSNGQDDFHRPRADGVRGKEHRLLGELVTQPLRIRGRGSRARWEKADGGPVGRFRTHPPLEVHKWPKYYDNKDSIFDQYSLIRLVCNKVTTSSSYLDQFNLFMWTINFHYLKAYSYPHSAIYCWFQEFLSR